MPVNPPVKISDIVINEDKDDNEFLTIICEDTLEKSDNLHLLLLGYSEHNLLDNATIETPFLVLEMGFGDSNCITDGQISTYEFLEYAKEDRFEAFIIQSGLNLFFDVQEISRLESLNAYQLKDYGHLLQTSVYSSYYPDSLTPKYMNIQEIKSMTERYHEIKKSREHGIILQDDSKSISSSLIPDWIRNNASW